MMPRYGWSVLGVLAMSTALGAIVPSRAQAGTVLVFFEQRDKAGGADANTDLYVQRLTTDGEIGWAGQAEPIAVANGKDFETAPVACTDGAGGAILVYEYRFATGEHAGDHDIVAQRVDASGKVLWNEGKSPAAVASSRNSERRPVVLSDGAGGAFVAYEWQGEKKDTDVLVQRLDGRGQLLWGEGKRPVVAGASTGNERRPVIVPDGQGGIIVLFEWNGENGDVDIMAQRISAEGQVLWNEGKQAAEVASTDARERRVAAIPDGQGGAIAVFEYEPTAGENKGDVDIMAQRISDEGKPLWGEAKMVGAAKGREHDPIALSDGQGGVIAAFGYTPVEGENAGDTDVLAQRLNSGGQMLWNEGKKSSPVGSAKALERTVRGLPMPGGGALFVFELEGREGENVGQVDVMGQRLSADGQMLWNEGKRSAAVCSSKWRETGPILLSDGAGGAIVVLTATGPKGEYEGDQDVEAARLSADGALLWNEGKKPVDIAAGKALEYAPCVVVVAD